MSPDGRPSSPRGPIPKPIRGIEPGTWAEDTVSRRMPAILRRTIEDNDFTAGVEGALTEMMEGMPHAPITKLQDSEAPDAASWEQYIDPYRGMDWLQVPWFFAETYFYRRILAETGYFVPKSPHYRLDPFHAQKSSGLGESERAIRSLISQVNSWNSAPEERWTAINEILRMDLWGNRDDLSNFPPGEGRRDFEGNSTSEMDHVIIDERDRALSFFAGNGPGLQRLDIVLDNVGYELAADLALADLLLGFGWVEKIQLRLRPHPMFVSDAHRADLEAGLRWLGRVGDPGLAAFGERVKTYLKDSRLTLKVDLFWASPCSMWEMPPDLMQDLGGAQLVILKGDLNYRRLLGDRHWPLTTPFGDIVRYFPTALLAIRTLKAELACCLEGEMIARLEEIDPDWLTNGDWGVIQFWDPETTG